MSNCVNPRIDLAFKKIFSVEENKDLTMSFLDIWSSFLTRNNLLNRDALPAQINKPELKKALDVLAHINFTEAERNAYEDRLKWLRIETNTLKKQFNDGKAESQTEKSIEIAKKMLERGTSIQDIADIVGLSATEINKLAT